MGKLLEVTVVVAKVMVVITISRVDPRNLDLSGNPSLLCRERCTLAARTKNSYAISARKFFTLGGHSGVMQAECTLVRVTHTEERFSAGTRE